MESGEAVRLETRPHGIALAGPLARAAPSVAGGSFLVVLGTPRLWPLGALGALLLALGALAALRAVLAWDRTRLVLTSERLFMVYGVVRRRAAAVSLARAGAIEVDQTLLGRALGYGTIVAGELEIEYVPGPRRLYGLVERLSGT
jgi:uncharacterized membrane protein YdbT with pleckstrin-like domain